MAHLRIVPKRAPTRHDLEQQLDALAREYGVGKDKKVFEQMLEVCRRLRELKKPRYDTLMIYPERRTMVRSLLIVDDEPNFLKLLDRILSKEGFRVTVAEDGFQAIDYADQELFDIAILDIRMHPMNGVALLKEFKRRWPDMTDVTERTHPISTKGPT